MINKNSLFKTATAWVSIVYTVCFAGVALIPSIRPLFMKYALHMNWQAAENDLTLGTFISGLIIWNIVAFLSVGLFATLFNATKNSR